MKTFMRPIHFWYLPSHSTIADKVERWDADLFKLVVRSILLTKSHYLCDCSWISTSHNYQEMYVSCSWKIVIHNRPWNRVFTLLTYFFWELEQISDGSNYVRSSMFDLWKPKIGCSSSITKKMTTFESVRCTKKWCSSLFDEIFYKSSECLLGSIFDVRSFQAKIQVFEFDYQ